MAINRPCRAGKGPWGSVAVVTQQPFRDELDAIDSLLKELTRRYKAGRQETAQLHSLVGAMEADYKKASRLLNEHEKMAKDKERARAKINDLLEKLNALRI